MRGISSNPNSKFGPWWSFLPPRGPISKYRSDYEICHQWSPLDKLISCKIKAGTKVVIGNGQSATCSDHLSYPASSARQIYIQDALQNLTRCKVYTGVFKWKS